MASPRLLWVLWLLLWHAGSFASSGSALPPHQLKIEAGIARHLAQSAGASGASGSQLNAAACGADASSRQQKSGACAGGVLHHHPESTSLHNFVYSGDFAGFKKALSMLAQHENFPHLLGALQMNDAQGMTITHLLACSGRAEELKQLMDVLFRMQGDGVETIRRIVLESRNNDACKGKNCELLADRPGLYAHGTLHFNSPPQQVVLFGDVTPFECAAAHGHIQAMKLLVQGGVAPGKAFEVAGIFTLTKQLHQAIQLANSEGFFAQPQVVLPNSKQAPAPCKPRRRRR
ncbi:hypothetical protein OEZ86_010812 [Tetradesmus obliquus]|nr:hypothetical protein OEZ86_010812 [Tetradesmus obliquus]